KPGESSVVKTLGRTRTCDPDLTNRRASAAMEDELVEGGSSERSADAQLNNNPSISFCKPSSESATIPWSSANLTPFSNFSPTITPSSMSSMASIIIASAYTVNNNRDEQHPCRTPLPTTLGSEHFSPMRTVAICSLYKPPMSLLSRQSTPILFNTSNIFTQFTLSKSFLEIYKTYKHFIALL